MKLQKNCGKIVLENYIVHVQCELNLQKKAKNETPYITQNKTPLKI